MIYLWLAIISSVLVSTVMRLGEGKVKNNMAMFVSNYAVCALLSRAFMGSQKLFETGEGMELAIGFGLFSGVLYLASFVLLQYNIRKNGVVLSATFMKLGVLIPTLMAIVVFHERPKVLQVLGILLAILAIILIHFEKESKEAAGYKIFLVILLVGSGFTDSTANIYDKLGNAALKDHYLLYTFAAAGLCAFALWIREKQSVTWQDVLTGICIGIPNYFSSRFLLLALHSIPAVIVYPVYSVATIVIIAMLGLMLFHEKMSKKKAGAIGLIVVALALLNI